jgi:hypothetical protein
MATVSEWKKDRENPKTNIVTKPNTQPLHVWCHDVFNESEKNNYEQEKINVYISPHVENWKIGVRSKWIYTHTVVCDMWRKAHNKFSK